MNVGSAAGAARAKLQGLTIVTRVKMAGSNLLQAMKQRFQSAATEFHDVMAAEQRIAARRAELDAIPETMSVSSRLAGFLVSLSSNQSFRLYEGNNAFAFDARGAVMPLRSPGKQDRVDCEVRIDRDEVTVHFDDRKRSAGTLVSNDVVTISSELFQVKLLPQHHRTVEELTVAHREDGK